MLADHSTAVAVSPLPSPQQVAEAVNRFDVDVAGWLSSVLELVSHRRIQGISTKSITPQTDYWADWVTALSSKFSKRKSRDKRDPWQRKAASMYVCLVLRAADRCNAPVRSAPHIYKTSTWSSAAERMIRNVYYSTSRGRSNPWKRWSMTVSKNTNRRWEGRYASGQGRHNQGVRTATEDQGAELSVCVH